MWTIQYKVTNRKTLKSLEGSINAPIARAVTLNHIMKSAIKLIKKHKHTMMDEEKVYTNFNLEVLMPFTVSRDDYEGNNDFGKED